LTTTTATSSSSGSSATAASAAACARCDRPRFDLTFAHFDRTVRSRFLSHFGQFEDAIAPYLDATKKIYKDMLAARKNDETGKIEIVSQVRHVAPCCRPVLLTFAKRFACSCGQVFDIRAVKCQEKTAPALFPSKSPYSFCYVVLNPVKRQVVLWYMPWRTMFG